MVNKWGSVRILHLYFQLHLPHQLNLSGKHKADLFQDDEVFAHANETEYQPFFALLERNSQKFSNFKISLGISGQWFEQAEKYDPELIQRLKKLINLGRVQVIALPFDYSLAWFYDQDEFKAQVELFNCRIRDYFGLECSIFAMPELIYNDKIASWAEKSGYSGMIIGEAESILDWRTPNRIYDAKNCKDLRLICQNTKFSRAIIDGQDLLRSFDDKTDANIFSLPKFQKELDLEFLRGNLVNLCLDTSIFRRFRQYGVIKFFDGFISEWLAESQNRFYNALEVIGSSQPKNEISIKSTIMRHNLSLQITDAIVPLRKIRYAVPPGLNNAMQAKFEETLYALRDQVLKTENDQIIRDFERLTALDYIVDPSQSKTTLLKMPSFSELSEILMNFGQKVFSMMPRPAKIAKTAGPGRVDLLETKDDFAVKVHRINAVKTETKSASKEHEVKTYPSPQKQPAPDTVFGNISFDEHEAIENAPSDIEDKNAKDISSAISPTETEDIKITRNNQDIEDAALNKHARIEISLSDLPEAEIIQPNTSGGSNSNDTANSTSAKAPKLQRGARIASPDHKSGQKRNKRRRVIIE